MHNCQLIKLFLALELEWCRARARAHWWQEECLLLNEEMHRVLAFFKWQASDWRKKALELENALLTSRIENSLLSQADIKLWQLTRDGKIAYAYWQANICNRMFAHFVAKWMEFPAKLLHMEDRDAHIWIECHWYWNVYKYVLRNDMFIWWGTINNSTNIIDRERVYYQWREGQSIFYKYYRWPIHNVAGIMN